MLENETPKCPICLDFIVNPIKPNKCNHIFCEVCLMMWTQKKDKCPLCRANIEYTTRLYFPIQSKNKNNKLNHLYYNIENLKLDNYGKINTKCLVCNKKEPEEQLILCDLCNYFNLIFSVIHQ